MDADLKDVTIEPLGLKAILGVPPGAVGLVIFAHGSGSGRLSPRNSEVARKLREAGLATLLLDLLLPDEERDRANVFDMTLLASRLAMAANWARRRSELEDLPIGLFGASTGGGAALVAAANDPAIAAVVSRGGRPDLAGESLPLVRAPTLLIVGGADTPVIEQNRSALDKLRSEKDLVIVAGASHLFEEPGTLEEVTEQAKGWFLRYLPKGAAETADGGRFADRREAGRRLAAALLKFKKHDPIVLALPRGGVPVAFEVAKALDAPLDVALVRKIGAPGHPELGLGAIVDGRSPELVLNDDVIKMFGPDPKWLESETQHQLAEIERRRRAYSSGFPAADVKGRTVIVVDDGIATGATVTAVLRAIGRHDPARRVVAVPVAPREAVKALAAEADDVVVLVAPGDFGAVGFFYDDFSQTSDREVIDLLRESAAFGRHRSVVP